LVTNYYARPGVAEIMVQDNPVEIGDSVVFVGNKTGVLEQLVNSMQVEHEVVDTVERGSMVAIKVDKPVRRNDKLYKIVEISVDSHV
jgi:putative protease